MELKLRSGSLLVVMRARDTIDSKLAPSQTLGLDRHADVLLDAGKAHELTISVIGNRLGVIVDGAMLPGIEHIGIDKSRVGGVAIVARPGTNATITRLRVRPLR